MQLSHAAESFMMYYFMFPNIRNKTGNVCINVTLRHVHTAVAATEKQ
jgi:hypothetical protein